MTADNFHSRLKELREGAGLTQKALAEKAGVALRTVSSLEQGLYAATWPTVLAIAGALGVECTAFAMEPADRSPTGPGRPPKAEPPAPKPVPKPKPRRKPKGSANA